MGRAAGYSYRSSCRQCISSIQWSQAVSQCISSIQWSQTVSQCISSIQWSQTVSQCISSIQWSQTVSHQATGDGVPDNCEDNGRASEGGARAARGREDEEELGGDDAQRTAARARRVR